MAQSSAELKGENNDGEFIKWFSYSFAKLGKMRNYRGCQGEDYYTLQSILPPSFDITAIYMCNAEFDNGHAGIRVVLIRHNGNWQTLKIFLNSDLFIEQ